MRLTQNRWAQKIRSSRSRNRAMIAAREVRAAASINDCDVPAQMEPEFRFTNARMSRYYSQARWAGRA